MKKYIAVLSLLILCLPLFTQAHPGHGDTDGYTIIHYIVEPVHALVWVPAITAIACIIRYITRYDNKKVKI